MKKIPKTQFIRKPVYPGGNKAINKCITENLHFPEEAFKNNIEGKVFLKYDVNYQGEVENIEIEKGLGYGCDEEAIRVIKLLKYQTFKNPGLKVVHHYKTWINFILPVKKEIQIIYHYIEKPKAHNTKL